MVKEAFKLEKGRVALLSFQALVDQETLETAGVVGVETKMKEAIDKMERRKV